MQPGGAVSGIDLSADFIAEAVRRAGAKGLHVDLATGDAQHLPFPDDAFDVTRIERVLISLDDPDRALAEMVRVTRPGGRIAIIAPDSDTNTVNVPDAALVRAVLAHEADTSVVNPRLVRDLRGKLENLGLEGVELASRMVVFSPDLGAQYFGGLGHAAARAGVIDADAGQRWTSTVAELPPHRPPLRRDRLLPPHRVPCRGDGPVAEQRRLGHDVPGPDVERPASRWTRSTSAAIGRLGASCSAAVRSAASEEWRR